jgi:hypothetical protein
MVITSCVTVITMDHDKSRHLCVTPLGGTVASPALQAEIEQHLHEARTLVTQAQEAAERGDQRQVDHLVGAINIHTTQAIQASKEQKK